MKRGKKSILGLALIVAFISEGVICPGLMSTGNNDKQNPSEPSISERGQEWDLPDPLPNPRFIDNGDGTVTDTITGLVWLKNSNPCGRRYWGEGIGYCEKLADGQGGLSDGSHAGDWRLPTVKELQSLINYGAESPCLPAGHPFVQAQSSCYWSGTVCADHPNNAWRVHLCDGLVDFGSKDNRHYVWPVRFSDR